MSTYILSAIFYSYTTFNYSLLYLMFSQILPVDVGPSLTFQWSSVFGPKVNKCSFSRITN